MSSNLSTYLAVVIAIVLIIKSTDGAFEKRIMESHLNSVTPPELKHLFIQTSDARQGRSRRGFKPSVAEKFTKFMTILKSAGMMDCGGRVVCDLNCAPKKYGKNGEKILDLITEIQNSNLLSLEDLRYFATAKGSGHLYWWTSNCVACETGYPECFATSDDLIDVSSLFDIEI